MLTDSQLEEIRKFAEEVAVREGCLLYDLEFHDGPNRALRVFLDKSPGGVSIEDCANVSRGLNLRLDVEDIIPGGQYSLEVSSPGLDRKLTQVQHYTGAMDKIIRLQYRDGEGQVKPYEGKLIGVDGTKFSFENSKGLFELGFENIQKARIHIGDAFKKKAPPGKKHKKVSKRPDNIKR